MRTSTTLGRRERFERERFERERFERERFEPTDELRPADTWLQRPGLPLRWFRE